MLKQFPAKFPNIPSSNQLKSATMATDFDLKPRLTYQQFRGNNCAGGLEMSAAKTIFLVLRSIQAKFFSSSLMTVHKVGFSNTGFKNAIILIFQSANTVYPFLLALFERSGRWNTHALYAKPRKELTAENATISLWGAGKLRNNIVKCMWP